MLYVVKDVNRSFGKFKDPESGKEIAFDNHYFYLVAYNEDGSFKKAILPKIKTAAVRDHIEVGDLVEVYNNEYKQPAFIQLVQKGVDE